MQPQPQNRIIIDLACHQNSMILSTILCTSPRRLVKKLLFGILFCYNSTTLLFVFALDVLGSFSPFGHFSMDLQRCHCNAVFFFFFTSARNPQEMSILYIYTRNEYSLQNCCKPPRKSQVGQADVYLPHWIVVRLS